MNNKILIKRAYSLPEILITLVIIAVIALLTVAIIPKKKMKEKEKPSHGTYACAYFDGVEHYYATTKKDSKIPTTKDKWSQGKCGQGFIMPAKSGIMDVKVVGAGGAGGSAKGSWDTNFTPISTTSSSSYRIEGAGYYDVTIYGGAGQNSSLSVWNALGGSCAAPISKPGRTVMYKGYVYLNSGDMVTVNFVDGIAAHIDTVCGSTPKPVAFPGLNGKDISVSINGSTIASVKGSGAGIYSCNPSLVCSNRFTPIDGSDGTFSRASAITSIDNKYNVGIDTRVDINWSSKNTSTRLFKKTPGCGGMSGEVNSTLYPILKNTLPKIMVGKPGTPTTLATATTFGALKANPGENNKFCDPMGDKNNGTKGISFSAIKDLVSYGGNAGTSTASSNNGGTASSFGSGGGGGAYFSYTDPVYYTWRTEAENNLKVLDGSTRWYEGIGGNGGSGLLILSW